MKLFEYRNKLPQNAGNAQLNFCDTNKIDWNEEGHEVAQYTGRVALRKGRTIHLNNDKESELYPLLDGRQFIYRYGNSETVFFGGQDEQPFLVRLNMEAFRAYQEGGEEAFFEALKPQRLAEIAGDFNAKLERQGDIFYASLGEPWEEINRWSRLLNNQTLPAPRKLKEPVAVFETRHRITKGTVAAIYVFGLRSLVAQGTLEAPDHAARELQDVSVLEQTQHLYSPSMAD